jgi:hypothetical protein
MQKRDARCAVGHMQRTCISLSRLWNQWSAFWYWKSEPQGHIW